MSKKTVEMALQESLLWYLGKNYSTLVSAIETVWKDKTINLSDTILRVTCYAEIDKGNEEDSVPNAKVLTANIYRVPKGTCIMKECVERRITTHYTNCCWVLHPKLRAKYSFCQMRLRRSNQNLKKTSNTPNASIDNATSGENTPKIASWQLQVLSMKDSCKNC